MGSVLIRNGRVWDGSRFFGADVLTEGDRIARLAPDISDSAEFVFDAWGMIVSAGLVDIHSHLRGISSDKYGMQAEMACFPFGVTATADGGGEQGDKGLLDACMVKTAVFACAKITENFPELSQTAALLERYGDRAVGIKTYFSGTQVQDTEPLKRICAFARGRSLPVMVHCTGSPVPMSEILQTLGSGDILTHAFHGGIHTALDDGFESLKAAQKRGVWIDGGFAGHVHTDFAVLKRAVSAGILPDTISTDITRYSGYKRGGRYGMTMCMSMARTAGMEEEVIFRAVTATPAEVLGKAGRWGCLREGGCADIAVLEYGNEPFRLTDRAGNTLENQQGYRCALTIADGEVVYRHR